MSSSQAVSLSQIQKANTQISQKNYLTIGIAVFLISTVLSGLSLGQVGIFQNVGIIGRSVWMGASALLLIVCSVKRYQQRKPSDSTQETSSASMPSSTQSLVNHKNATSSLSTASSTDTTTLPNASITSVNKTSTNVSDDATIVKSSQTKTDSVIIKSTPSASTSTFPIIPSLPITSLPPIPSSLINLRNALESYQKKPLNEKTLLELQTIINSASHKDFSTGQVILSEIWHAIKTNFPYQIYSMDRPLVQEIMNSACAKCSRIGTPQEVADFIISMHKNEIYLTNDTFIQSLGGDCVSYTNGTQGTFLHRIFDDHHKPITHECIQFVQKILQAYPRAASIENGIGETLIVSACNKLTRPETDRLIIAFLENQRLSSTTFPTVALFRKLLVKERYGTQASRHSHSSPAVNLDEDPLWIFLHTHQRLITSLTDAQKHQILILIRQYCHHSMSPHSVTPSHVGKIVKFLYPYVNDVFTQIPLNASESHLELFLDHYNLFGIIDDEVSIFFDEATLISRHRSGILNIDWICQHPKIRMLTNFNFGAVSHRDSNGNTVLHRLVATDPVKALQLLNYAPIASSMLKIQNHAGDNILHIYLRTVTHPNSETLENIAKMLNFSFNFRWTNACTKMNSRGETPHSIVLRRWGPDSEVCRVVGIPQAEIAQEKAKIARETIRTAFYEVCEQTFNAHVTQYWTPRNAIDTACLHYQESRRKIRSEDAATNNLTTFEYHCALLAIDPAIGMKAINERLEELYVKGYVSSSLDNNLRIAYDCLSHCTRVSLGTYTPKPVQNALDIAHAKKVAQKVKYNKDAENLFNNTVQAQWTKYKKESVASTFDNIYDFYKNALLKLNTTSTTIFASDCNTLNIKPEIQNDIVKLNQKLINEYLTFSKNDAKRANAHFRLTHYCNATLAKEGATTTSTTITATAPLATSSSSSSSTSIESPQIETPNK